MKIKFYRVFIFFKKMIIFFIKQIVYITGPFFLASYKIFILNSILKTHWKLFSF